MSAELDQTRPVVAALRKIIAEADKYPFNPIGHVVEHVVPDARAALEAALSTLPQQGWRPIESARLPRARGVSG